ncbi:MAG: type II secretion system GspH family protein [Verrucomicrobiota bacterium]|nr:type II secretion system GspH family protein [Verrucomicrobiota bacterium]
MILSKRRGRAGFTLLESLVAAALMALFLGTLFALNTSSMQTIRMARESAGASQLLQQRVESLRIANWHQVTDADWLKTNLLNTATPGAGILHATTETVTLIPYDSAATGNTQLVRTNGVASIVNRNATLLAENAVKVIWTVAYNGAPNNRVYARQVVAVLAKGGVAK